jgi:misacylated tRNA(Ala) deacylase
MNEPLYLRDCYLRKWKTRVKSAKGKFVVLEDTAFYAKQGGQPWDTGTMKRASDGKTFRVVYTGIFDGKTSHEVDQEGIAQGDEMECELDWERRYLLMRHHTAAHVLSRVIFNETGALMSGNQLGLDRSRIDFALDTFDKERVKEWIDKANGIISEGREVSIEFMPREEAIKIEGFERTLADLVKKIDVLRVVQIKGLDKQGCGGTHVRNTSEIGRIVLLRTDNKGKSNRRVYFALE